MSGNKTPNETKGSANPVNTVNTEKMSGKKLKQARLPFKILSPAVDASTLLAAATIGESKDASKESLKRKLSYETDIEQTEAEAKELCKENFGKLAHIKKQKTADEQNNVGDNDDNDLIIVEHSTDPDLENQNEVIPKVEKNKNNHENGAGTPKTTNKNAVSMADKDKNKDDNKMAVHKKITSKNQANKRRKSLRNETSNNNETNKQTQSSDDLENIADQQNPLKRKKIAEENVKQKTVVNLETSSGDKRSSTEETECSFIDKNLSKTGGNLTERTVVKSNKIKAGQKLTIKQQKLLEQRRRTREEKELKLQEEKRQKQKEKEERELAKKCAREEKDERRRKEREEKEVQRRKEREEKEEQRRKERAEKDMQKRKEKEEKDEQKRIEREGKERRRMLEVETKNEEKRKKEQEKEEAELKQLRAAAAFSKYFMPKQVTRTSLSGDEIHLDGSSQNNVKLAFQPFQIKGDMTMAPIKRKILTAEQHKLLDSYLCTNADDEECKKQLMQRKSLTKAELYLSELASGKIIPGKWLHANKETNSDDEVLIIDDVMGQVIVEEQNKRKRMRAKFFKFDENRRPAYYGTWRKKSSIIKARRPFAQDTKFFDYEVDSDYEWEDEELGESLDSSDEEKDKESEDEDYDVDNEWMVPHGHLSEEELQNDDELEESNTREAQKVKLQILQLEFAQEMKKKTKKIKPRIIGCIWADENCNKPKECPQITWETINKYAMFSTNVIVLEEPKQMECDELTSPPCDKIKPLATLNEDLQKQLVRLTHGNKHSKTFLINEFMAYLDANVDAIKNGESLLPSKAMVREKIDEYAEWKVVDACKEIQTIDSNGNGNSSDICSSVKKSKKPKKRLCWVVADDVLERFQLQELTLYNKWSYIQTPKFTISTEKDAKEDNILTVQDKAAIVETENRVNVTPIIKAKSKKIESGIKRFTEVLAAAQEKEVTRTTVPAQKSTQPVQKKRVPLLLSVGSGERIPISTKNAVISKYLKKMSTITAEQLQQQLDQSTSAKNTTGSNEIHTDEDNDDVMIVLE